MRRHPDFKTHEAAIASAIQRTAARRTEEQADADYMQKLRDAEPVAKLQRENARLRAALEWYAGDAQKGKRAREALGMTEQAKCCCAPEKIPGLRTPYCPVHK